MLVYMPYQPRQTLYKDMFVPLTSPFSSTSPSQNFQPLAMTHPNHNPFKPSEIFLLGIAYLAPLNLESQAKPQNESFPKKKFDKNCTHIYIYIYIYKTRAYT